MATDQTPGANEASGKREREKKKKTESGKVNYLTLQSVFYEQVAPNCAAV